MNSLFEDIIIPIGILLVVVVALIFGIKGCSISVDNVPIIVKVDGKEVYKGTSAAVETKSDGATTTITINGGFLYFFPKAYFTSKNIEIIGDKRNERD